MAPMTQKWPFSHRFFAFFFRFFGCHGYNYENLSLVYGKLVDQCFLGFDDKTEYVTSGDAVIMDV